MTLVQTLSAYVAFNLLIVVAWLGLFLGRRIVNRSGGEIRSRTELQLNYWVAGMVIFLAILQPLIPPPAVFTPPVKVWFAQSVSNGSPKDTEDHASRGYLSVSTPVGRSFTSGDRIFKISLALAALVVLAGSAVALRDLRILRRLRRQSHLIRKIGRVRVMIHDQISIPYSVWRWGRAEIVVPSALVLKTADFRIAVLHELQHHRQRDTLWVYGFWWMKWTCLANPAIHMWSRQLSELQEFACDEALLGRSKVESLAYARCLIEVAKTAVQREPVPVGATGLAFWLNGQLLKRRIDKMLNQPANQKGWIAGAVVVTLLTSAMGAVAYASRGMVQDRRITLTQAKALAIRAQDGNDFPIVVNEAVVKQLNRYVGTPDGREFIKNSLARMQSYKPTIEEYLHKYGVPREILAVPIVESGYQNLTQAESNTPGKTAGIWQFIPSTARKFGVRVDQHKDERLNIPVISDAAMRYLQINNLRFKDWHLSLLSFNMGEENVQKAIDAVGSRDAWALIRNGYEGDKDYLPKIMAAILILKNPQTLE